MNTPKKSGAERRRFSRINATLWVQIAGLDEDPQPRRGNLSMSGAYFEIDRLVASPGNACLLRVGATREGPFVEVMSRVVRVVSYDDLWDGHVAAGVAFDFVVRNDKIQDQIARIVRLITEGHLRKSSDLQLGPKFGSRVKSGGTDERSAVVEQINLNGVVLQTDWPMQVGEIVRITIEAPSSKKSYHFEGQVVRSRKSEEMETACYSNEIRFEKEAAGLAEPKQATGVDLTMGYSIADAVNELMAETIGVNALVDDAQPVQTLRGLLQSVRLDSLLGFLELERMTGSLSVTREKRKAILFVSNGKLIDIVCDSSDADVRRTLSEMVDWQEGEFEFAACSVDREDRFGEKSTSVLLLELATQRDEDQRGA